MYAGAICMYVRTNVQQIVNTGGVCVCARVCMCVCGGIHFTSINNIW